MQSTGIVRRLDQLGRITLPMELRKTFELQDRAAVEIFTEDDRIILKKYVRTDTFTGEASNDLIEYKGQLVSKNTIKELARIAGIEIEE